MIQEYTVTKENGQNIRGCIYLPAGNEKHPLVIFSHGFGGNYRFLWHHGKDIMNAGIACMFFDFCGGGPDSNSDGKMEEMTVLSERDDLKAVFDYALTLDGIDKDNIFLMGESQGGFVSTLTAREIEDKIKGLILWYPAFVIPEGARKRCPDGVPVDSEVFGMKIGAIYNKTAMEIDIYEGMDNFSKPVLIIHGDKDPVVPISYSEKAKNLYPDCKYIVIEGAGHGFDGADSDRARNESISFMKEILAR
ncbi:MAG: lysophospholipase [Butyrivibrio sp.]|nr:lysophospholipase [Butyrivibrio sp.]